MPNPSRKKKTSPSIVTVDLTNSTIKESRNKWAMLIIILVAAIPYLQTLSFEYVLDDQIVFTDNQFTKKGFAGISELLSTESFSGYFGEQKNLLPGARYRPLSLISFAIEHQFFGLNSALSHGINILLYALLCLLIYFTLSKLIPQKDKIWYLSIPFIATLLYTIHPIHSEAVANVKGRDEILSMIFSMLTLYAFIKSLDGKKLFWYAVACASFFLGLLSKENTLTYIAIIPLAIYFFRPSHTKTILSSIAILTVLSGLYLLLRYNVIGYLLSAGSVSKDIMNNPFIEMNLSEKYATIMYTLGHYLRLIIFPHPLTHDYYPFQIPTMQWSNYQALLSLAVYISLIAMGLYGFVKRKIWAFGILFYLITLSIVSNLVINVGTTMNERFVFMASLGICICLAHLFVNTIPRYTSQLGRTLPFAFVGLMVFGFAFKSFSRIPVWRNAETLNSAAVNVSTNSARANSFMATALYEKIQRKEVSGDEKIKTLNDADYYATRALQLYPNYNNANLMKAGIVAEKYVANNDIDYLLAEFKAIASRRPDINFLHQYFDYLNGRESPQKMLDFYYDVGYNVLYNSGRYQWAIRYLEYGVKVSPDNYNINIALQKAYAAMGNNEKASQYGFKAQSLKSKG